MDVSAAKVQAAQLTEQAARLDRVKSGLTSYSGDMHAGWQGVEVPHISRAIDDAKKRLTTASRELREIAADIVAAANEIQAEEAAAAAGFFLKNVMAYHPFSSFTFGFRIA